ncbi:hypothetical protein BV20DRAFT_374089 [Pilatotrama ljubarskyi]|nr:hypothetical protein BV20DRAFT_374089 [Pilatotrama ljubarskyi]
MFRQASKNRGEHRFVCVYHRLSRACSLLGRRSYHMSASEERERFSVTTMRWLYNDEQRSFNRVFSLTFDNNVELIAKIPYPCTGPRHLCTASEVATLDFLRTELGLPVPHVRSWCSRAEQTAPPSSGGPICSDRQRLLQGRRC